MMFIFLVLHAREFKLEKAKEMWVKWVKWRVEYKIDIIDPMELVGEIETGKGFIFKHDKEGNTCINIRTRYHFPE